MANLVVFWAKNDVFLEILAVFKTYLQNIALDFPNSFTNVSPWLVELVTKGYRPKWNFQCNTYSPFWANYKNFINHLQKFRKNLTFLNSKSIHFSKISTYPGFIWTRYIWKTRKLIFRFSPCIFIGDTWEIFEKIRLFPISKLSFSSDYHVTWVHLN